MSKTKKNRLFPTLCLICVLPLFWYCGNGASKNTPQALQVNVMQKQWVDSVFNKLTPKQRLGQLFMVAANTTLADTHKVSVAKLIRQQHVGGVIFMRGYAHKQLTWTNYFQKQAKTPLMVAMDAEWGLGMRLKNMMSFPFQMTLGAIQEDTLIYQMGAQIAQQMKRLGTHINFAPVVDVNINPKNPVIGYRSFSENRETVARKGVAYMKGLQDHGIQANAKHFPGHGDTGTDSHFALPVIKHGTKRLDSIELYPFKALIRHGVKSMMVAHLNLPAYDSAQNRPATLSKNVVTKLLKEKLGYQGLIFTDALNMKAVTNFYKPGEVDLQALIAGNDVLLAPENVKKAIEVIQKGILQKKISQATIDQKVKKVLAFKYALKLNKKPAPLSLKNLYRDLRSPAAKALQRKLYQKALTIVKNKDRLIPFRRLDTLTFASVNIGKSRKTDMEQILNNYASFTHFHINALKARKWNYNVVLNKAKKHKVVIVSIHDLRKHGNRGKYGLSKNAIDFIKQLEQHTKVIINVLGTAYSLQHFEKSEYLTCAYEDNKITRSLVPQMLFGAFGVNGRLPVSAGKLLKEGRGVTTQSLKRLAYGVPAEVQMNKDSLRKIDVLLTKAIKKGEMPGCQVIVARKGKVVWHKAYGHQTYARRVKITPESIYDIASITKVAGTLPAIMYLYEKDSLKLDDKVVQYLQELKDTNKDQMTVREVLTHQAGLLPYLPYWKRTLTRTKTLSPTYYRYRKSTAFPLQVAQGIYGKASLEDSLWKWSIETKLRKKKNDTTSYDYTYSDLSFYTLKRLAEQQLKQPIEKHLHNYLYKTLGVSTLGYNPLQRFKPSRLVPTEYDRYFRRKIIRGTVHDQGAAMHGGVAGHAGLFSNVNDLAKYLQMHLQKGEYGGIRYFEPATIDTFIRAHFTGNRRGLGWDKKPEKPYSYTPSLFSQASYGHSGFTGCVVWADPKCEVLVVFLSNRIYPSAENKKLIVNHTRHKLLDQVFRAIVQKKNN
ncbi:glycoside hydrolase family 3 N-terminal domain-containing protein [uncultured Microscilla sp.]|uniref:glycoside hydrolase family 3 N-terminal domain-containing protein n=1 Tax=uncultured Microscilla sp. TaxID=432653 RepID=UPI00260BB4C7|nr:glycoside hydrolase family 3 N-terminal domain-containing protein [uncultured Microscilla sp.]